MSDLHQKLMDEAYEWWQNDGKNASRGDFITHCKSKSQKHLDAVVAGNLNYQVCNGGFGQWVDNGYAVDAWDHVEDLLNRMGTKNSKAILRMLESFKEYISFDSSERGCFGCYWISNGPQECGWCDMGVNEGDYDEETDKYEIVDCEYCNGSGYEEEEVNEGGDIAESRSRDFWEISEAWMVEVEDFLNDRPLVKADDPKVEKETVSRSSSSVKYPKIKVELVGQDGNAFSIMGRVSKAMRRAGVEKDVIDQYTKESMSGDYDHLLQVAMSYVDVA